MRSTRKWIGLSLALVALACAPSVQVSVAPGSDFSTFDTYAVVPSPEATELVQRTVEAKVRAALDRRGYRSAPVGENDLLVLVQGRAVPGRRQVFAETPGGCCETQEYIEGTMVVELFDTASGQRVWRGVAQIDIDAPTEKAVESAVTRAVDAILDELPARSASLPPGAR